MSGAVSVRPTASTIAPDPVIVRFAGHGRDDLSEQAIAMVRIFEARTCFDRRWQIGEIREQLALVEEWRPVEEIAAVQAIAHESGAVRQQLADPCLRALLVQAFDIVAGARIEVNLVLIA